MSVNLSVGIDPRKTKHLGQYFHTIDFHFDSYRMGYLTIGAATFKMTYSDLEEICGRQEFNKYIDFELTKHEKLRIVETCQLARDTAIQKYRLNV